MSHDEPNNADARILAAKARQSFEEAVESLDVGMVNRLRLLRREALASPQRRARAWLLPAGAMAATALSLVLSWRAPSEPAIPPTEAIVVEDLTPTEFPSEDEAELYAWLGEAPVATAEGTAL